MKKKKITIHYKNIIYSLSFDRHTYKNERPDNNKMKYKKMCLSLK